LSTARFVLFAAPMRKHKTRFTVPPAFDSLFPHRDFPPYVAVGRVHKLIGEVFKRQRDAPPNLDRLQSRLADVSERLIEAANGQLQLSRWYRRIAVSVRLCHETKVELIAYVRDGAIAEAEAHEIEDALDAVIARLHEALARPDLPDEVRASLASMMPMIPPPDHLH
jgi:hypothetical protein